MPQPPDGISAMGLLDLWWCETVITIHKRKIAKTEAFDAKKAKVSVFGWLLKKYPNSVIIPEFGIGEGGYTKTSIADMAVFDTKRMIFVEIKAENDTYARVAKQLEISALNADEVWLAIYESKAIPKEIHENVGILSLSGAGKVKVIRKAKPYKHPGTYLGHIWTTEWQDVLRPHKGSRWLREQREGLEGLQKAGAEALGKNARKFTIAMWRHRYWEEFVWRRDMFLAGKTDAVHTKRGMNNNDYWRHFNDNYDWRTDRPPFPHIIR